VSNHGSHFSDDNDFFYYFLNKKESIKMDYEALKLEAALPADPHLRQYLVYSNGENPPLASLRRTLRVEQTAELEYQRRKGTLKTTLGWGQRKLAIGLLEFLTLFAQPNDIVVYAGAAPGTGTVFVANLFPEMIFHLYDPAPNGWDQRLFKMPNVKVFTEYFTDSIAIKYTPSSPDVQSKTLFLSDIRTGTDEDIKNGTFEKAVMSDMNIQMHWHELIRPRRAQYKFRLPYKNEDTTGIIPEAMNYLNGIIFKQAWAKPSSTETRLVPFPEGGKKLWDNKWYEDIMFQHNVYDRTCYYKHTVKAPGLDHCFDCASEVAIFRQYLLRTNKQPTDEMIANLSMDLSFIISGRRDALSTQKNKEFGIID